MTISEISVQQQRLLDAQDMTVRGIEWWTSVMVILSFALLLLAFTPDSLVLSDNAETEMPFVGSASIKLVLILGPLVLVLFRLFISSYLHHWHALDREIGRLGTARPLTLSVMKNATLYRWASFVHFPLVVFVLLAIARKGLGFPAWGPLMAALALIVTIWLIYLAAWTRRWFNLMVTVLVALFALGAVPYNLMTSTDLLNRIVPGWAGADDDEDKYVGSFILLSPFCKPRTIDSAQQLPGCVRLIDGYTSSFNGSSEPVKPDKTLSSGTKNWGRAKRRVGNFFRQFDGFFLIRRQLDLSGADMERADLRHMNLKWANMTHANLAHALMRFANVQDITATDADFRNANFGFARMQHAFLRRADLRNANFWATDLREANLINANMENARVQNSNLTNANLERANLRGASLRSTVLAGANLRNAKLQGAMFGKVGDRPATDLTCADLRGADMSGVRGLDDEQLKMACTNKPTRLPAGSNERLGKCECDLEPE